MGAVDVDPGGYTQEDKQNYIKGSRRANEMKEEIGFVLGSLARIISRKVLASPHDSSTFIELFRVPVGRLWEQERSDSDMIFCLETSFGGVIVALGFTDEENIRATRLIDFHFVDRSSELRLAHIKQIYDVLPKVMDRAVGRFPDLASEIAKVSEFAEY